MAKGNMTIRMEPELKAQAAALFKTLGECHIEPDWLLVYKVVRETLILKLIRTGSHSDLF